MSPEKLESLRRLAVHEDTPPEEARTAAMLYVRNVGPNDSSADAVAKAQQEILDLRSRLAASDQKTVSLAAELKRAHDENARLGERLERAKKIVERTKDLSKAVALVHRGHEELGEQIREFDRESEASVERSPNGEEPRVWSIPKYYCGTGWF